MRYIGIAICLGFLWSVPSNAGGLHWKILVVHGAGRQTQLDSAVSRYYNGGIVEVEWSSVIPSDLGSYDAVLISFPGLYDKYSPIPDSIQTGLISFVSGGGKLYLEDEDPWYSAIDTTLWHYAGVTQFVLEATETYFDSIKGVDSLFTHGLYYAYNRPFQPSSPDDLTFYPSNIPVLIGNAGYGPEPVAWISADTSKKIVSQWLLTNSSNYYDAFIGRMLCDYFGLCAHLMQVNATMSDPNITLRTRESNGDLFLDYSSPSGTSGNITIIDILGRSVTNFVTYESTESIKIPENLHPGFYLALFQSGEQSVAIPISLVR